MSKKDFEALAAALVTARNIVADRMIELDLIHLSAAEIHAIYLMEIARVCKKSNTLFDTNRFINAAHQ